MSSKKKLDFSKPLRIPSEYYDNEYENVKLVAMLPKPATVEGTKNAVAIVEVRDRIEAVDAYGHSCMLDYNIENTPSAPKTKKMWPLRWSDGVVELHTLKTVRDDIVANQVAAVACDPVNITWKE